MQMESVLLNGRNLRKNVNVANLNSSTPLMSLKRSIFNDDIRCMILVKIINRSVTGSSKDDLAKCILEEVEKSEDIDSDTVLISYSSGNLSIALANAAVERKYKTISVLPFSTSQEKLSYLRAMGSKVVLAPHSSTESLNSCHFSTELISIAQNIHKKIPDSFLIHPYEDSLASEIFYEEMADSIISQCDDRLDIFVCGTETLGMITKLSEKIKAAFPHCKVIGIKSVKNYVLGGTSNAPDPGRPLSKLWTESEIEDLGCPYNDLHPPILAPESVDDWITVEDKKSFRVYLEILESEGILCSPSSGALVAGAIQAIGKYGLEKEKDAKVVVIFQESFGHAKVDSLDKNVMVEKNYLTNLDFSKKKWWWGVFIGNLQMKAPPIVEKDSAIGNVIKKIGRRNGVVMDKETILGVVTPELSMILESNENNSADICQNVISDVPGCFCTDFKVVNHSKKTLGDVSLLLIGSTYLIITGSAHIVTTDKDKDIERSHAVETIVGVLTKKDILRYITKVEGHHRKQSNWDVKTNTLIDSKDLPNQH